MIRRSPLGVLLGIMPWNFPYYQVARFAAPNLVLGNTIVLKHARQCPESAAAIEAIYRDAGLPEGAYLNVYASLDQTAYHCDAVAVAQTEVLLISRRAFIDALGEEDFRMKWIALLSRELRRVRALSQRLSLRSAQARIVHYIEAEGEHGRLLLSQTKKDWAAELGLTHESLYRTLGKLERDGIVVRGENRLRIT